MSNSSPLPLRTSDAAHRSRPTICIVAFYFGQVPGWTHLFFESCRYNHDVRFLFVTDDRSCPATPPNMKLVVMDLPELIQRTSDVVGVVPQIEHPYKMCDFRPAFGLIFAEWLREYDFWGYCDIDLIFGDISRFISTDVLLQHDVITAREEFMVGHFTLIRNNEDCVRLYSSSKDALRVFRKPRNLNFEECGHICSHLLAGKPLHAKRARCDSITHVVRRLEQEGLRAYWATLALSRRELRRQPWRARWSSGQLTLNEEPSIMYLHFHPYKHLDGFSHPTVDTVPSGFEISVDGFHPLSVPLAS
jgi:hypothetical protein